MSYYALVIAVAFMGATHADAVLTFTPSTLSTASGGTVEFDGTLTNTGAYDLYLNGDTISPLFPGLTVDDSPFIFFGPMYLAAGDSFTGAFIDVTADAATPSGSYNGTYTIQGGTDSNTFDDIATADFTLDVGSPVPEPNPILLLVTGLTMLMLINRRI